jgi:hypothetical protein
MSGFEVHSSRFKVFRFKVSRSAMPIMRAKTPPVGLRRYPS